VVEAQLDDGSDCQRSLLIYSWLFTWLAIPDHGWPSETELVAVQVHSSINREARALKKPSYTTLKFDGFGRASQELDQIGRNTPNWPKMYLPAQLRRAASMHPD
jgi:hypothetical protein